MEMKLAQEIIDCLPRGRSLFHYGRYGYAPLLLSYLLQGEASISELRKRPYGKLLQTPLLKVALSQSGKRVLELSLLEAAYWCDTLPFVLTLDLFDGHMQTSRRGVNLVLQLNFSADHDREYVRLTKPGKQPVLRSRGHPVMQPGQRELFRETLAWSRIDLEFASDEALIEEVQSDWVRSAAYVKRWIGHCRQCKAELPVWFQLGGDLDGIERYIDQVLAPYLSLWQEAMLSASIDFIYRELGIRTIYYHSHETGGVVQRIAYGQAPQSLYSRLPKKFCLTRTAEGPEFLQGDKTYRRRIKKVKKPSWYRLALPA
ncbi:MAG: hypothetical protein P8171_25615 [Candidatus Thiodiazotropha sp.]